MLFLAEFSIKNMFALWEKLVAFSVLYAVEQFCIRWVFSLPEILVALTSKTLWA